mgnify:CR=1 FL=1
MPDLFRLKGESYEKEIYIFSKYTIPVQISEAASPCRRSASCFHNAVYSVFRTCRKILIFYRKPGFLPLPLPVSIPVVFREAGIFLYSSDPEHDLAAVPSSLFDVLHRYFAVHSPDDVVLWKDGILSFQTMENQPQPLTALCTPDDARDSKIIPFPTLSERQRISQ